MRRPGAALLSRVRPESVQSAKNVGLRHVTDREPGITRVMGPLGFRYVGPNGRRVRDAAELARIRALAIPPAWTDVWICRDGRGHVQATGRDAKGRKQYRYHANWSACRGDTKFDRLREFAAALPRIRARTEADLARLGLPRRKVLAAVVQLLEKSLIRVGNEEYARQNGSFGLTTLKDKHVDVRGAAIRFEFRGKSGVKHVIDVNDRRLARIVKQCRDLPGQDLFQYVDGDGRRWDVTSGDVNAYLREISGKDFTAKDFRTWSATVLCATALGELQQASSLSQTKKNLVQAIEAVAGVLGNTRAVCRTSYIHPAVAEAYLEGVTVGPLRTTRTRTKGGLRPEETAVLRFLEQRALKNSRRARAA